MAEAIKQFEWGWNEQHERKISDVRNFIRHNVQKAETHHGVCDLGGQGRHVSMPDEVVREIGAIIAKGHTEQCSFQFDGKEIEYIEGLRFTSLSQAIRESTQIQQLLGRYLKGGDEEGRVKYLLRRLHEVVPTLVYQHLPMKRALSADDKIQRVTYSDDLLEALEEDPDMLDGVYWGDECSIWLNKHECGKLMCWFEKHDVHGLPPADNVLCDREGCGLPTEQQPVGVCWAFWAAGWVLPCVVCAHASSTAGWLQPCRVCGQSSHCGGVVGVFSSSQCEDLLVLVHVCALTLLNRIIVFAGPLLCHLGLGQLSMNDRLAQNRTAGMLWPISW